MSDSGASESSCHGYRHRAKRQRYVPESPSSDQASSRGEQDSSDDQSSSSKQLDSPDQDATSSSREPDSPVDNPDLEG